MEYSIEDIHAVLRDIRILSEKTVIPETMTARAMIDLRNRLMRQGIECEGEKQA